jgi:hypothetical protein
MIVQYNILKDMIYFVTKITNKIHITQSLRQILLTCYHEYLLHPGQTITENTISNSLTLPGLTKDVEH